MNDFKTLSVYASHAQKYDALTNHEVKTDPLLERFISGIPNGGRTLDIGCGPGNSAGIMAANGLQVDAWDLVSEMLQLTSVFPVFQPAEQVMLTWIHSIYMTGFGLISQCCIHHVLHGHSK